MCCTRTTTAIQWTITTNALSVKRNWVQGNIIHLKSVFVHSFIYINIWFYVFKLMKTTIWIFFSYNLHVSIALLIFFYNNAIALGTRWYSPPKNIYTLEECVPSFWRVIEYSYGDIIKNKINKGWRIFPDIFYMKKHALGFVLYSLKLTLT